jgi:hypothetical protein
MAHLTDIQRRALILADNKFGENASWDDELLGLELAELKEGGFDLGITGFTAEEWDALIAGDTSNEGRRTTWFVPRSRNYFDGKRRSFQCWWRALGFRTHRNFPTRSIRSFDSKRSP